MSVYKNKKTDFPKFTINIFFIVSIYLVLPIIDMPILGLSVSAPLLFLVVLEAVFRPPLPWSKIYRPFIALAFFIWLGIFLSASLNGMLSGGVNINQYGMSTVIHYAYWLIIFVVSIYVATIGNHFLILNRVLGWSILVLALLRWGEVLIYGNLGAWTGTHLLSENDYGLQFSTYSPFLLGLAFIEKGGKKTIALVGYIFLLGAVAVNGSRGSWVGISAGIVVLLVILMIAQPRSFWKLFVLLITIGSVVYLLFSTSPRISLAVTDRFDTLQNLDQEKSYMIRTLMNQKALRLFKQSPFFGVGAGRFTVSSVELQIPRVLQYANQAHFNSKSAHNSYLSFLAEDGLIGSIPYAILLIFLTVSGWKTSVQLARQSRYWELLTFIGFIGMSVHMWVMSALTNTSTWFIYGLLAATIVNNQSKYTDRVKMS